jgi:hypothetical protein
VRRSALILCAVVVSLVTASTANAKPGDKLPFITGGGLTQNNNSGGIPAQQQGQGGFNARAVAPGTQSIHPVFQTPLAVFPARGQVQAKSVAADGSNRALFQVHGDVVCIADYGPSAAVDGGGNANNDVWEIRFRITKSNPPGFEGFYASLMVQDNGKDDFADESGANPTNPQCGLVTLFELEPQVQGNIVVHDD